MCVFFNPYISGHTFIVGICLNLYIYIYIHIYIYIYIYIYMCVCVCVCAYTILDMVNEYVVNTQKTENVKLKPLIKELPNIGVQCREKSTIKKC